MNDETQALATISQAEEDTMAFELIQRQAKMYAQSDLVPKDYQNKIGNCVVAMEMANRLGMTFLQVAQSLYVVRGRPTWKAEFVIGRVNQSKAFKGNLHFKTEGEGRSKSCMAWTIDAETGERIEGEPVTWEMVERFGWHKPKKNKYTGEIEETMWIKMPGQMFRYRAAAFFSRIHCPEALMGLPVEGEVETYVEAEEVSPGSYEVTEEKGEDRPMGGRDTSPGGGADVPLGGGSSPSPDSSEPSIDLLSEKTPPQFSGHPQKPEEPSEPAWKGMNGKDFREFYNALTSPKAYWEALETGDKRTFSNRKKKWFGESAQFDDAGRLLSTPPGAAPPASSGSAAKPITYEQDNEIGRLITGNEDLQAEFRAYVFGEFDQENGDWSNLSEAEANQVISWLKQKVGEDVE